MYMQNEKEIEVVGWVIIFQSAAGYPEKEKVF